MSVRILAGDCRAVLVTLPAESVHCIVTSPPYFGLRDYGTARWEGGDEMCSHEPDAAWIERGYFMHSTLNSSKTQADAARLRWFMPDGSCRCGARRIDRQIGLEPSPDAYVATLVDVFRKVRRVLRRDGTLWLNIGDSYANDGKWGGHTSGKHVKALHGRSGIGSGKKQTGMKPKDMIGIPWRLAFALQADGWWLRQDIIWHKPNPMPESVTDRCTKAHEYVFMLTRAERYYYDAEAIAEPAETFDRQNSNRGTSRGQKNDSRLTLNIGSAPADRYEIATRNKRSVWTVASEPFPAAHFATYPPALIEPCILAGTSERGCCPHCGAPWRRIIEVETRPNWQGDGQKHDGTYYRPNPGGGVANDRRERSERGWSPSCSCPAHEPVPCTILDPFLGAGTTALVADRLGRNCIGIDLSPAYADMARQRIAADAGMFAQIAAE